MTRKSSYEKFTSYQKLVNIFVLGPLKHTIPIVGYILSALSENVFLTITDLYGELHVLYENSVFQTG